MGYLQATSARLQGPNWQAADRPRLLAIYKGIVADPAHRDIPPWMFSNVPQGRGNLDMVFVHCASDLWKIELDEARRIVDPRLKRENQDALLRSLCGEKNWDALLSKFKLRTGINTHYQGSALEAFLSNFSWAFHNKAIEGHLHYTDFIQKGMFSDTMDKGKAWHLTDHILREDFGLVTEENGYFVIDQRLLPDSATALAKTLGFNNFTDLKRTTGLHSLITTCPAANGTLEGLLAWRYPSAFDPKNPKHSHYWEFRGENRFRNVEEERDALVHLAVENEMPVEDLHYRATPDFLSARGLADLSANSESTLELFTRCFAEEIQRRQFDPERFYAKVEFRDGQSYFVLGDREYSFTQNLSGSFARRESKEHIVIYARAKRRIVGVNRRWEFEPAYVVLLDNPSALVAYSASDFSDLSSMEDLERELKKIGISPVVLSLKQQKTIINLYGHGKDFKAVRRYLKNEGLA